MTLLLIGQQLELNVNPDTNAHAGLHTGIHTSGQQTFFSLWGHECFWDLCHVRHACMALVERVYLHSVVLAVLFSERAALSGACLTPIFSINICLSLVCCVV